MIEKETLIKWIHETRITINQEKERMKTIDKLHNCNTIDKAMYNEAVERKLKHIEDLEKDILKLKAKIKKL